MKELEEKVMETKVRSQAKDRLIETGKMEELKNLLKKRLVQSQWRDKMKQHCKELIKSKGVKQITVASLTEELTPLARQLVPNSVKQEILGELRKFIAEDSKKGM